MSLDTHVNLTVPDGADLFECSKTASQEERNLVGEQLFE